MPKTLERITAYLREQDDPAEIIVVDDGSEDDTVSIVEGFIADLTHSLASSPLQRGVRGCELSPHMSVENLDTGRGESSQGMHRIPPSKKLSHSCERVHHHPNISLIKNDHRGKGYAVRTGMLRARGQYVLFSDADLSTPIEEVARLLPWFDEGYDVVIGSREGPGAKRYGEPSHRHMMGRAFNLIVRLLAVRGIKDTQCGFKCFRGDVAHDLFSRVRLYGPEAGIVADSMVTAFDVEVLFLAQKIGYRIKEVPVEWHYFAESKVNPIKDSIRNFRDVCRVRLNDLRGVYDG